MATDILSHDETEGEIDSTRRPITEPRTSTPHIHRAQRDLFASEERLRALVAATSQIIWVVNTGGSLSVDSPSWRAFTGQTAAEIQGLGWLDALHPEDRTRILAEWNEGSATSRVHTTEYRLRRYDGVYHNFAGRGAPALDEDGSVREWVCVCTDITERKQTEHLLRLSEERFQLTFDNAPVGMALVSLDGLFVRGNHALSDILGYTSEELAGLRFQEITHPDDLERDLELIDLLLRDEIRRYELAKRYLRKDGSIVHAILYVALVRDRVGKPLHFISQIQDVTERKRAQEAQRINDERFRLLTTHLPVAVFQADTDGRFTYVNDRWHTLCDLAPEEAVGSLWTATVHPDDRPRVVEAWGAATREQRELSLECRFQARGGESRWASASVAAMRDEAGRIIGYFGSFTDITEPKRAEELARQSQERVIEAQRATLAELSTPLIPINGEIMIMPLIGAVDPQRARQVLHTLLTGISANRARVAILDITGVPTADEQVASALVNAAQAVRLLGAQTVLSGVRPEVAQILATLGADLRGIVTCGDLQAAIGYALHATRRRA